MDLAELVGEACELVRPTTEAAGVALSAELPPSLAAAEANPDKLRRVLLNLLQNAIHHTPPDGSVAIRAAAADGALSRSRSPTPARASPRRTAHTCSSRSTAAARRPPARGPGSGLGLAIARAIVEAHGGRIWLAEAAGGTHVRFTLPAATPAAVRSLSRAG